MANARPSGAPAPGEANFPGQAGALRQRYRNDTAPQRSSPVDTAHVFHRSCGPAAAKTHYSSCPPLPMTAFGKEA